MAQTPAGVPVINATGAFLSANVMGGGGWVTRGAAADDGTLLAGTDVAHPVIRKLTDTAWHPLLRPGDNIPTTGLPVLGQGTYDVALCDTNSNYMCWITNGAVFTSADGAATCKLRFGLSGGVANEALRMTGKMVALDPINGLVILVGCTDGLRYTTDGGNNWTLLSAAAMPFPVQSNGHNTRYCIAFDRSSPQVGGKTQGVYVFVNGVGLYHSTAGVAGPYTAAPAGGPVNASHMAVGKTDGVVHLCGAGTSEGDGQYYNLNGSTWSAPGGVVSKSIALHPSVAGTLFLLGSGGNMRASTNNGSTWSGPSSATARVATKIPWHAWTNEGYMSNGCCEFNRNTGDLWFFEGIGTWKFITPSTTVPSVITAYEQTDGIENLNSNLIQVKPSSGDLLYACWDRSGFVVPRAQIGNTYPSTHVLTPNFQLGMDLDWAWNNETFLFSIIEQGQGPFVNFPSGYSSTGAAPWTSFATDITSVTGHNGGGNIVALSDMILLQVETNNGWLMRSPDRGTTWNRVTIGDNNVTNFHTYFFNSRRCLMKDKLVQGTAYIYCVGDGTQSNSNLACQGIWKTTDYGVTWNRIKTGYLLGFGQDYYSAKFYQIGSNDWVFFGGDGGGNANSGLQRSTDGMVTWTPVTGTDNINGSGFAFGWTFAVAAGLGPAGVGSKAILVAGHRTQFPVNNPTVYDTWGWWLSVDNMATWNRMAQCPGNYYCFPSEMAADPLTFGRYYVARGGEGVAMLTYTDKRLQT